MNSSIGDEGPEYQPLSADNVFDAAWEARARKALDVSGWDSGLAIAAARDALAVVAGDLSEDEFQARHHGAYLREFGVDLRPGGEGLSTPAADAPAGPAPLDPPAAAITGEDAAAGSTAPGRRDHAAVSRRTALGLAGGGIATVLVGDLIGFGAPGQAISVDDPTPAQDQGHAPAGEHTSSHRKVRMGMVMDLEKCDGCLMCVGACKQAYSLPDGVFWIYVLSFKEPDRPDDVNLLVRTCQHCVNAPCVKVCPTGARHRRDDGLVLTDYDVCFGCRYCQVACPYGVNYFGWDAPKKGAGFIGERKDERGKSVIGAPPRGVMGKCIFDPQRQDSPKHHGSTHCQMACPMGVIHFGDLNDPESEPNRYLRQRIADSGGKLSTFHLLDDLGTKPNVIYIGHQPSRHARPTDPPTRYEDWGMVDERRTVLEGPEPWFKRVFSR
ncbi:MAG: 4Fe-4S dicluster domain-containing protein [Thermoflexaceae bacterium]|nr:4Fe-4S dicluster domain-containing protein [Thermoflexaceae bacterium]